MFFAQMAFLLYDDRTMVKVELNSKNTPVKLGADILRGKRNLTEKEIAILKSNQNYMENDDWSNFYVSEKEGEFNPSLIQFSFFLALLF